MGHAGVSSLPHRWWWQFKCRSHRWRNYCSYNSHRTGDRGRPFDLLLTEVSWRQACINSIHVHTNQELVPYKSMQHVVIIIVAKWLCTCLACMCVYHSSQRLLPCMMVNSSFCHTRRRGDSVKSSYVPAPAARETTAITAGRDPVRYTKPAEEINMEKIIGKLYLNRSK